ncbi:MAG: 2-dehydro-3-deoxygalactonokinase [Rhizobacter sp.]|nr:2-dehydro-3-deoxygalactonokinase [Rhizobacter sp.]
MSPHAGPELLGIDWGTSNRRAWWLGRDGAVLAEHSDAQGLLASQGRFEAAFDALLKAGPALPPATPVLMSGMVGAASGWVEAPYLAASEPLTQLARRLCAVPAAGPRCFIVPGICFTGADGRVDVMRGEETQLLGALALGHGDGWYLLPGTHSKWVQLLEGRVADLATYMTGELFALLTSHGTLASVAGPRDTNDDEQPQAFARGVAAAARSGLSNALFGCRAQVVAGRMPAGEARSHLSGLLIGAEWHDVVRRAGRAPQQVTVIGAAALAARHALVAEALGCRITTLDSRSVQLAALQALRAHL